VALGGLLIVAATIELSVCQPGHGRMVSGFAGLELSLPWLDCVGSGFSPVWDRVHSLLKAAVVSVACRGPCCLATLPVSDFPKLPWDEVSSAFGPLEAIQDRLDVFQQVLGGYLHPRLVEGYCHLGAVVLKYVKGRVLATGDRPGALREFSQAWEMLAHPPSSDSTFDFLESTRWGELLCAGTLLRSTATAEGPALFEEDSLLPQATAMTMLDASSQPLSLWSSNASHSLASSLNCVAALCRSTVERRNVSAAALSTHIAVLEPVATLRVQLLLHGVHMFTHFLGAMHPRSGAACDELPQDSSCTRGHGWGSDVHRYLHSLGDMRDERFEEVGFMAELVRRVEIIHRRHIAPWADFVVCAHPFLLCALLRALTDVFMLIYLTPTPLTFVPQADRFWVLAQLALLAAHRSTLVFAASPLYALHALYQTGVRIQPVRPSSLYISQKYKWRSGGDHSHIIYAWGASTVSREFVMVTVGLFHRGRQAGLPWLQEPRIIFKELAENRYVGWEYLAGVRCVVLLPWDLQLTVFPELYALGVPIVLPTAEYIAAYGLRTLAQKGVTFWGVHPRFAGRLPGPWSLGFDFDPWLHESWNQNHSTEVRSESQFLYWFRASDFETFGHTLRFDSVPQLLQRAAGTSSDELQGTSAAMQREWAVARRSASTVYEKVACHLLCQGG